MIVSLNWVKDYLNLDNYSIEDLEKAISLHVIEIESLSKLVDCSNLTIGHVLSCVPHPDSDHLHVCQVDLGDGIEQIVCGAPNVDKDQYVIVSKVGAVLPGDIKIKKGKIRGIESNGMICSLQELGLEEKYVPEEFKNGIYVFKSGVSAGDDPLKKLALDDVLIELGLTPNRGDLLSILGFAYDLGAVLKQKVTYKMPVVKEIEEENPVHVEVLTPTCKEYNARYIKDCKIQESPWWLKERLIASGIRPINNIVDITNYVLMELGQPLHSFDAKKLGTNIVVRNAIENEKLITLDEIERTLAQTDCVITDGNKACCLGGVMGGLNTAVDDTTTDIILEAAYFDPSAIRKTSGRINLKSDSSVRYERKVAPSRVQIALNRACELLVELADGKVLKGVASYSVLDKKDTVIQTNVKKINRYLGTSLTKEEMITIFTDLAFSVEAKDDDLVVSVPSRRVDISNQQDLMEEIARMYGYDNIPSTIPSTNDKGELSFKQSYEKSIKDVLSGLGLHEVINYSLVNGKTNHLFTKGYGEDIKLQMPMSEEREYVRQSLLNSLTENASYNMARKMSDISIYEVSRVYSATDERTLCSGLLTGNHSKSLWQGQKEKADFFFAKGILEVLAQKEGIVLDFIQATDAPKGYHPNKTASVLYQNEVIGYCGYMHPSVQKENDLNECVIFELDVTKIINRGEELRRFVSIPKFPTITRDLALVVDQEVTAKAIVELIKQTAKKMLTNIEIFDLYQGDKIESGKKSIALSLTFQDTEKTLEASDVDKKISSIVGRLERELKASLRS